MIRKLTTLINKLSLQTPALPVEPEPEPPAEAPVHDERTRPSYRVGKHKPEDIYRALDIGA
jgi:hypothetical protein